MMDESDSSESNNETNNESNEECNESDNKLTQYMLINKELSKTLVVLRAENARLRNNNKVLNLEILTYRNELTSNRNEVKKWRTKFAKLQAMHILHVETLTTELQSYADKLTGVFGSEDDDDENVNAESEITSKGRLMEQRSVVANSDSINDDREEESVPGSVSKSTESSKLNSMIPEVVDENPSSLNTINEESEDDLEISCSEQISLVTSTHGTTTFNETHETTTQSVCDETATKTIVARQSMSDSCEMASMNSDKENQRPSSLFSCSELTITNGDSRLSETSILTSHTMEVMAINDTKKSTTPLKEQFITRRTHKRKTEQNSFDDTTKSEMLSSTPYKRKRSATYSETSPRITTHQSNDSSRITTRRSTMSMSTSGRPRRNVCPSNLAEPKLNTKMRRPRT